jgi:uncharacterized protein
MIRTKFCKRITDLFQVNPIVSLVGPRQCGKTTLAREYNSAKSSFKSSFNRQNYFDLENLVDIERLRTPELALSNLVGLVTIDEIQRAPELFPTLRTLVDRTNNQAKFLILGSASRQLIKQSSESLAGRISYIELTPFDYTETKDLELLWLRGGFPRSFLAETEAISNQWRTDYIRTFLEQDIPNLGIQIPPVNLRRFWIMLAHYHGNVFNASELGNSLGLTHTTIRKYLDILAGTFMVRQLPPWFANIKKRQVKSPKIFFRDSGILHTLLNINSQEALHLNPKLGASWEGFALEEIIRIYQAEENECYFWAIHNQAELDLLIIKNGKKYGFEFKYTDHPKITSSMQAALRDLDLDSLTIIYPGKVTAKLAEKITAVGLKNFLDDPTSN